MKRSKTKTKKNKLLSVSEVHIEKNSPYLLNDTRILCNVSTGRMQPKIPISLRASVFKHFHSLAHPGIRARIALLTEKGVWLEIKKHVAQWTCECLQCNRSKIQRHNTAPFRGGDS